MQNEAEHAQAIRLRKKDGLTRGIQFVLLALIAGAVALGLWAVVYQQPKSSVPTEVAGYRLVRSVEGAQAVQMVTSMHRGTPQISSAWVAFYEGDATIWMANTATSTDAQQQLQEMLVAISQGNTPFTVPQQIKVSGRQVFMTRDGQRSHIFYQNDIQVVWVALPIGAETKFLEGVLRKL